MKLEINIGMSVLVNKELKNIFPELEKMEEITKTVEQAPFLLMKRKWLAAVANIAEESRSRLPEVEKLFQRMKSEDIQHVKVFGVKIKNRLARILTAGIVRRRAKSVAIKTLQGLFNIHPSFLMSPSR